MKKRLLSALMFVSFGFFTVSAQDYWVNEDFSSDEWQNAIRDWISITGVGTFPENTPSNVDVPDGTEINGYTLNGAYIRPGAAELGQSCPEGGTHQYGFRLRRGGDSYIQLPEIADAKRITLHVRNGNGANPSSLLVEEYDPATYTWNLIEDLYVQPSNDYAEQDEILEVELNRSTPVTLRVSRGGTVFVAIYKLAVEKMAGGTSIQSTSTAGAADLYLNDRTLHVTGNVDAAHLLIYDVCGKMISESAFNGNSVQLPASVQSGTYIVKLVSQDLSLTKKVCIQ